MYLKCINILSFQTPCLDSLEWVAVKENKLETSLMTDSSPKRISANDIRAKLDSDGSTLLVCIYPTEVFNKSHLEGAISLEDFESRLQTLPKSAEIAFY